MAIEGRVAAIIAVADPIKESTPAAIGALHALGLKVAMVTGDNRRTAEAIGRSIGIDEIVAEVLPDGKVQAVRKLGASGARVAFGGDRINDAPALAAADVGIVIGTGTDIHPGVRASGQELRCRPDALLIAPRANWSFPWTTLPPRWRCRHKHCSCDRGPPGLSQELAAGQLIL